MTSPRPAAAAGAGAGADDSESLLARAVRRRTGDRYSAAADEVRRLLEVGLELIRDDPDGNPRIADIVRRAGVSNDAFYRAFRSKNDLMAAIADDGARRLVSYVRHQRDKATDPTAKIRAAVAAVFKQAADPAVAATTRAVLRHSYQQTGPAASGIEVRRRIAELLAPSLADCGSADPDRDAIASSCAVFGVMEQFLWTERTPAEADIDHLVAWMVRAGEGSPAARGSRTHV